MGGPAYIRVFFRDRISSYFSACARSASFIRLTNTHDATLSRVYPPIHLSSHSPVSWLFSRGSRLNGFHANNGVCQPRRRWPLLLP
jgi:hypothetical protein